MSKFIEANEKITEGVVSGYKKIEEGVVGGYPNMLPRELYCDDELTGEKFETL